AEHVCLKLQQLSHERHIWGDDVPSLLYKVEGLLETDALSVHEVGQTYGGRARDPSFTMHQHTAACLLHRV
ncbi:hypothetical protein NQD34_006846, partial [Periophthalmus magnuspinnatus]